ncbi:MAG: hypothetical protein M3Q65_24885, partial [Chloroflexota bacterium]|nr:hypothetical protein [Chloroflexota bacterium]
ALVVVLALALSLVLRGGPNGGPDLIPGSGDRPDFDSAPGPIVLTPTAPAPGTDATPDDAGSPTPTATDVASSEPVLTLTPDRGPCGTSITARGDNFPAGKTIELTGKIGSSNNPRTLGNTTVEADGTFAIEFESRSLGCNDRTRDGTQYAISAITGNTKAGEEEVDLASATFTLSSASSPVTPTPGLTLDPDRGPYGNRDAAAPQSDGGHLEGLASPGKGTPSGTS